MLFEHFSSSGGNAVRIKYIGEQLHVYVHRTGKHYKYDREGNYTVSEEDFDYDMFGEEWSGWEKDGRVLTKSVNNTKYCYEKPSFIQLLLGKGEYQFYLYNSNNKVLLYLE